MSSKIYGPGATSGDNIMKRLTIKKYFSGRGGKTFSVQKLVWHIFNCSGVFSAIGAI